MFKRAAVTVALCVFVLATWTYARGSHDRHIPDHLQITTRDGSVKQYQVVQEPEPIPYGPKDKCTADAITYCQRRIIRFYVEAEPAVLVHEAMHAMTLCDNESYPLHETIYEIAFPTSQLFVDNPDLLTFLKTAKSDSKDNMSVYVNVAPECK